MEPYSGKSGKITRIPRAESLTCSINSLNSGHCKNNNIYIYVSLHRKLFPILLLPCSIKKGQIQKECWCMASITAFFLKQSLHNLCWVKYIKGGVDMNRMSARRISYWSNQNRKNVTWYKFIVKNIRKALNSSKAFLRVRSPVRDKASVNKNPTRRVLCSPRRPRQ